MTMPNSSAEWTFKDSQTIIHDQTGYCLALTIGTWDKPEWVEPGCRTDLHADMRLHLMREGLRFAKRRVLSKNASASLKSLASKWSKTSAVIA